MIKRERNKQRVPTIIQMPGHGMVFPLRPPYYNHLDCYKLQIPGLSRMREEFAF